MDAVAELAAAAAIDESAISWAGLKDEEGVTEQVLCIPRSVVTPSADEWMGLLKTTHSASQIVSLSAYGYGSERLRPGLLLGNAFTVTIGNVNEEAQAKLRTMKGVTFQFLNYYDVQRFGRPSEPKINHLIGKALLAGDDSLAEKLYLQKRNGQADKCDDRSVPSPQETVLYKNAFEAYNWNISLASLVREKCGTACDDIDGEGHIYVFPNDFPDLSLLLNRCAPTMRRHSNLDHAPSSGAGRRNSIAEATLYVHTPSKESSGTEHVKLSFFLPSGCYATMLLKQLEHACSVFQSAALAS